MGKKKTELQRQRRKRMNEFLLTFFKEPHTTFAVLEKNGFILTRTISGDGVPGVSIYTPESFKRAQDAYKTTVANVEQNRLV